MLGWARQKHRSQEVQLQLIAQTGQVKIARSPPLHDRRRCAYLLPLAGSHEGRDEVPILVSEVELDLSSRPAVWSS
jgi:hypothetical protein